MNPKEDGHTWKATRRAAALFLLVACWADLEAIGEITRSEQRRVDSEIREIRESSPQLKVEQGRSGLPESIEGVTISSSAATGPELAQAVQAVENFIDEHAGNLFLLKNPSDESDIIETLRDPLLPRRWLVRMQQRVKGIRILGAEAVFIVDPERGGLGVEAAFGRTPDVPTEPTISAAEAQELAQAVYNNIITQAPQISPEAPEHSQAPPTEPDLIIINPSDVGGKTKDLRLSWRVTVRGFIFFVDALTGEILAKYLDHQTALVRRIYDLNGASILPGNLVLWDPDGQLQEGVNQDALLAYNYLQRTYDYYLRMFNRDSFDDVDGAGPKGGAPLVSYVRYGSLTKAYWDPDLNAMVFGPGYATALDVVAHELTHAVIKNQVGLVYQGESGALNEFFSDLVGAMVEGNWALGEALPGHEPPEKPLRDMSQPNNGGFDRDAEYSEKYNSGQPDHMSYAVKTDHKICATSMDVFNGCVHFNSGIWNKAAWLASEGGSHNDINVIGIGREKIARIFYNTLLRLNSTAKFARTAELSLEVCSDLTLFELTNVNGGQQNFTLQDCKELQKALQAVRLLSPAHQ